MSSTWTLELTPPGGPASKLTGVPHDAVFDLLRQLMYGEADIRHAVSASAERISAAA